MVTKSLCLQVFLTNSCNLDCKYCFQTKGNKYIQFEQFKLAFANVIQERKPARLKIFFCGGEPFLAFETMRQIVMYIDSDYKFSYVDYSVVTNGTLFNKQIVTFIKEHNMSVTVSLDGDEIINEFNRPTKSGSSSFEMVLKSLRLLDRENIRYFLNATLLDYKKALNVYHFLTGEFPKALLTITEAVGKQSIIKNAVQHKEYTNLWHKILDEEFDYFLANGKWRLKDYVIYLGRLISRKKTLYYCDAGVGTYCISTNSKLYPCYRLAEFDEYALESNNIIKNELNTRYNETCLQCNIRFFCGGGCLANAKYTLGDINSPCEADCFTMKLHLELSIYLYSKLFEFPNSTINKFFD